MRITEAAQRLGTSPRMLRYREKLGLLPPRAGRVHRQYTELDLRAVGLGLAVEQRYDVGPSELAFALRVLADPEARARVQELGERLGRLTPQPVRALDFDQAKAQRLLSPTNRAPQARFRRPASPPGRGPAGPAS
ncbi:MerR family transcriptional regulator [Actinocorallia sp. API 0066]|uniref:MerR family transcriptional regulator n=1 Tax=Actinocorallia sp. API 0066 TaxID=2896846 RepID=UPI001E413F8B|nr:MerR family transcriptional regulator [Actinocorallia sp. API 0066]MCD0451202.1 MerR family transcriptional regulator [Actinocorallia sp. API 0066]